MTTNKTVNNKPELITRDKIFEMVDDAVNEIFADIQAKLDFESSTLDAWQEHKIAELENNLTDFINEFYKPQYIEDYSSYTDVTYVWWEQGNTHNLLGWYCGEPDPTATDMCIRGEAYRC